MDKTIENSREICECGHERRDHYRGMGKCHQCQANMGLRCSHFKYPVTDYGKFWASLLEYYTQIRASGVFGMPRIFVSIVEIRSALCKKLKITKNQFNELLRKAVSRDEPIRLYGAPTGAYAKVSNPFDYEGKLYLYLSIGL